MRKLTFIFFFLTAICTLLHGQNNNNSEAKIRQNLHQLRRSFFDAQKQGDRSVLEQLLSDSFYFVHSTGVVEKKKEFIDRTIAQGARIPEIEFPEEHFFIYEGGMVVWLTRSVSRGRDGTETNFRATDVLVKKRKQWQWVSVHSTKLPTRARPVPVSADTLKAYVGNYQINADRILSVTEDSGVLTGQAPGLRQRELIPKSATEFVWFSADSNVDMRISFLRDQGGKVTHAVLRNEGAEVWRAKRLD